MYILFLLFISALTAFAASDKEKTEVSQRLDNAADVLHEIMALPTKASLKICSKANCIVLCRV
jgi:hypothetical protein